MATPFLQLQTGIGNYFRNSAAPAQAAALTLPLLLLYGVGITLIPTAANGVDFLSTALYHAFYLLPAPGLAYLGFYGILLIGNLALFYYLERANKLNVQYFLPLLLECLFYAALTGSISAWITTDLVHAISGPAFHLNAATSVRHFGPIEGIIVSAGAGLHEELVFRLLGIGAVARLWLGREWRKPTAKLLGLILVSSLLFSLAHFLGEPFRLHALVYRSVSGVLFGALFLFRGFAVSAWTHALYDIWVILVIGT